MENKVIIKTIEPDLEEVRKNLILMQQSPTPQAVLKCEKFFDFYTGKLRTISQCDSGYSTAESSRKSSLDTEENAEEITQVQKPKIFTIKNKSNEIEDPKLRAEFLMKQLLIDIYGRPYSEISGNYESPILQNLESDCTSNVSMNDFDSVITLDYNYLSNLDINEIRLIFDEFTEQITYAGQVLIRQLKRRDKLMLRRERQYDIITAYLKSQFSNDGDGGDTSNMRFSMSPSPGDSGYNQWLDAMKMVSQLPGGIPPEFRKRLWITLAERYLQTKGVNWPQTERACFNEWSNPDDTELGVQIVKDLHRTGCSLFCGTAGQENQALLKRVLLAYARWNKAVGYCQGFNMLAALILQVMDRSEVDSVKVMIYLIEGVLPESYFANNLRGLSVDMAVFRDLLRLRLPNLSKHLDTLQNDVHEGTSYEPPLTNVFTMQWFLTLFCNCLPQITVLRVWDLIFLEGNEVLLRTALAIWDGLADRILAVNSADEFYSIMGVLTREMLEFGFMDANTLVKSIVSIQVSQELPELRDKYLYNITPWTQTVQSAAKKGFRLFYSDDDDLDSDNDEKMAVTTVYGISLRKRRDSERRSSTTTSTIQPYAYGHPDREKLALDISALKQQYAKLRERQRQAHIILTAACARQPMNHSPNSAPIAMNHLLLGKSAILSVRGRRLGPPQGAVPPSRSQKKAHKLPSPKENGETIHWKDTAKRRPSRQYSQEELQKDRMSQSNSAETIETISSHHHSGGDSSSSYSSDQDDDEDDASSTSTELCDEPGRVSDIDDLADIPSDLIDSDDNLRTNNSSDVVKSVSESKLDEVKEMANLITHSFSESVLRPESTEMEFNENRNLESIEENKTSPEPEKSYLSNILENDEEITHILEKWNSPKKVVKDEIEIDKSISDLIENRSDPVISSPPKTPVEILIDFEQEVSKIKNEDIHSSEINIIQPQQIEAISNDGETKLIPSPENSVIRVKPKFETSRSIEVLRENQTILDNYLKQQGLKTKESDDDEPNTKENSVYSSLFFSETLCSNSSNSDRENIIGQSKKNSYDNNVILGDTTNNLDINTSETEPNFVNFVLQRSALSSNNCVNKSGASTPVNYFDFAKYLRDRGIDLSPEDILKIQQSPPDKVNDILEKLTPISPKSFSPVETNDQNNILEPFNLQPNTPEEISSTPQKERSDFEKFLEERIKFIKQLSLDSMSSTKVRFDSGSDWHKTPSTDDQCTDRKVSISSETGEEKDDVFEQNEILSPKPSSKVESSSDLSPETLEIIKKYEEIFDTKSEKVKTPEDSTTLDQKPKARLSFEKQISLDSLSIPEERLETGRRNSELALKIIQENSMILHKILQCQTHSIDELDENFKKSSPEIDEKSTNLFQATDDEKLRRNSEIKDLDIAFKWDPGDYDDNNIEIDKQSTTSTNSSEPVVASSTKESSDSNILSRPSSFSQLQFPSLPSPTNKKKTPSPIDNFNPFPIRSTTRQHKDVGLKLGLYKDLSPVKSPSK